MFDYPAELYDAPAPRKRDWRSRLFDRFVPQGDANLADEDKSRLFRQGLLQLAAGIQSSPNWSVGLANGLSGGLLSMNKGVDDLEDRKYKRGILASQTADPMGYREQVMLAKAAGYEPGTPGFKDWMRRHNGEIARASSAAIKYEALEGSDGKKRIFGLDPNRVGAQSVGDDITAGAGVQDRTVGAGNAYASVDPNIRNAILNAAVKYNVPPQHLFALAEQESSFNPQAVNPETGAAGLFQYIPGTAKDRGIDPLDPVQAAEAAARDWAERLRVGGVDEAAASHFAGPGGGNRGPKTRAYVAQVRERIGVNPFESRPKEAEAAAVAEAQKRVGLQYDPVIAGATQDAKNASDLAQYGNQTPLVVARESAAAEARETATALGKTRADEAKKKLAAHDTTTLLDAAELLLPKATGSLAGSMADTGAAAFGKSTEGARATAGLKAIAGQLTAKMPRMEGPQSNYDVLLYKEMAGDLANDRLPIETRMAALKVIRKLQEQYTGGQSPAETGPRRLKYNPATGKLE